MKSLTPERAMLNTRYSTQPNVNKYCSIVRTGIVIWYEKIKVGTITSVSTTQEVTRLVAFEKPI